MDEIMLYISKETKEKREYLRNFCNRIESMKSEGVKVDVYKLGMSEEPNFWREMYEDYKLPEEKCDRKFIKIGKEHQTEI